MCLKEQGLYLINELKKEDRLNDAKTVQNLLDVFCAYEQIIIKYKKISKKVEK